MIVIDGNLIYNENVSATRFQSHEEKPTDFLSRKRRIRFKLPSIFLNLRLNFI